MTKNPKVFTANLNIDDLLCSGDKFAEGARIRMPDGKIHIYKKGKLNKTKIKNL